MSVYKDTQFLQETLQDKTEAHYYDTRLDKWVYLPYFTRGPNHYYPPVTVRASDLLHLNVPNDEKPDKLILSSYRHGLSPAT